MHSWCHELTRVGNDRRIDGPTDGIFAEHNRSAQAERIRVSGVKPE